jgi:hypothetical protein
MKALLMARVWTGGTEKVFAYNAVKITANPDRQAFLTLPTPFALITPGDFQSDPVHQEEPNLMMGPVVVKVGVAHQDSIGEAALIGSNKIGGNLTSKGRGLDEIEPEVMAVLQKLNTIDGVELQLVANGNRATVYETAGGYRATKDFAFQLICMGEATYQTPTTVAAVPSGGGAVALSWTNPAIVASSSKIIVRRATGTVPPTIPTDGTGVAVIGGAFGTTATDAPGAGQYSYSVFMEYLDYAAKNYSAPISISVVLT